MWFIYLLDLPQAGYDWAKFKWGGGFYATLRELLRKGPSWMAMYKIRTTGTGNGMRGTQTMLYSRECRQKFQGMLLKIPGNVLTDWSHDWFDFERRLPTAELWPRYLLIWNISGNVTKHFGECPQTLRGMLPTFGINEGNYWAGLHLHFCQTSTTELFCENSQGWLFRKKVPPQMLNGPLIGCAVSVGCR